MGRLGFRLALIAIFVVATEADLVSLGQTRPLATVHHLILAVSIVRSHLSRDPWRAVWAVLAHPATVDPSAAAERRCDTRAVGALGLAADDGRQAGGAASQGSHAPAWVSERRTWPVLAETYSMVLCPAVCRPDAGCLTGYGV